MAPTIPFAPGATGSASNPCADATGRAHGFEDELVARTIPVAPRDEPLDSDSRPESAAPFAVRADEPPTPPGRVASRVRLIVQAGRARGQVLSIPPPRFLIGRDLSCHLRAHSPIVSRFHALIEQRDDRVFLRDLGSSNGTQIEGRTLRNHEETEVVDGQGLQVGPMRFTFAIEPVAVPSAPPVALSQHPHLRSLIQCPQCGTDGWFSIDQLLLAIARAVSQPSLAATLHTPAGMAWAHRNGHADASAHPAIPVAPPGHAVPPASTSHPGVGNGWGHGPVVGPPGVAVPLAVRPNGDGTPTSPSMPRRPGPPPSLGVSGLGPRREPPVPEDEDDGPAFPDVLDLLPFELAAAPTQELETRNLPAPLAPRAMEIDFHCPKCRAEVLVPVDRIDQQLECPGCAAKLYTDDGGGLRVGDIADRPRSPNVFEDKGPDVLGGVIGGWKALPRPARFVLTAAASVLLFALVQWVVTAPRLPATLKDRAIFVAEAFAREDYRKLRAIAGPGGARAVTKWMGQVRPRFWNGKIQKVWVKVRIEQQDKTKGKATLLAHVSAITGASGSGTVKRPSSLALEIRSGPAAVAAAPAAGADNRKIDLKLFWVLGRDGQWLLDATRTSAAAGPSQPTEGPSEPAPPERPARLSRLDIESRGGHHPR